MKTKLLSIAVTLGLVAMPALSQPLISMTEENDGPLSEAAHLREIRFLNLHLGMPADEVESVLRAQGYAPRYNRPAEPIQPTDGRGFGGLGPFYKGGVLDFNNNIEVDYIKLGNETAKVSGIRSSRRIPAEDSKSLEEQRQDMVAQWGVPTHWRKWIFKGQLRDKADYLTARTDTQTVEEGWFCKVDWECRDVLQHVDCRDVMRDLNGPVLRVSRSTAGMPSQSSESIELLDYKAIQSSLMTSRKFQQRDTRDAVCPVPLVEGGATVRVRPRQ